MGATSKLEAPLLLTEKWNTASNDVLKFFFFILQKTSDIERSLTISGSLCRRLRRRQASLVKLIIRLVQDSKLVA